MLQALVIAIAIAHPGAHQSPPARMAPAARAGLDWWSLQPVHRPHVPSLQYPKIRTQNPIDAFVLAELNKRGLRQAPLADRRTLIRRVYYDLIGLPPPPREIEAFVRDPSPHAYEKLVDKLLADPGYGERWGRHWLDVVRFGESQGFERDHLRANAWPYRDYVINAFNADKPYDRFVTEQLAGDVLIPITREGIAATGFLSAGPWDEVGHTSVSPAVRKRARGEELEDIIGTTAQTFLGLTANCARCHDHKFDPIPQRDYYRLRAALEGALPGERDYLTPGEAAERQGGIARQQASIASIEQKIDEIESAARKRVLSARNSGSAILATTRQPHSAYEWSLDTAGPKPVSGPSWTLHGTAKVAKGSLRGLSAGNYLETSPLPVEIREKTLEAWVVLDNLDQRGGSALTIQRPDGATFDAIVYGEREPRKWSAGSNAFVRTHDLKAPPETVAGKPVHVVITYGADNRIAVYRDGEPYGEPYLPEEPDSSLRTYSAGQSQLLIGLRHTASTGYLSGEVLSAHLYDRALTAAEVRASFACGPSGISASEIESALTMPERELLKQSQKSLASAQQSVRDLEAAPQIYGVKSTTPPPTHILLRGDPDNPGDVVTAGGLSCCKELPPDIGAQESTPEGERRLELAQWIVDRRNPLTARVMVNRIWHYHFGRGIVGTPNDFGYNGEKPTDPALLDWLAAAFMDGNWRIKTLQRMILLSETYRRSSQFDPSCAKTDADDRYLWRFPPRRLEGEAIRDAILTVSGRLNPRRGGPSFRPFTVVVNNSSFYTLVDREDPEFDRRTVYRMNINGARMPLLETLDCPDPSTKTPKRNATTTALQALELMNSTFVTRQASWFADRLRRESGDLARGQVERAYALALGRLPTDDEIRDAADLIGRAGLNAFCWSLFNMDEFAYVR